MIRKLFLAVLLMTFGQIAVAQVHSITTLNIVAGMEAEFIEFITPELVDTREYDGCEYFALLVDADNPGRVVFFSIWESVEHQQAYGAWRVETGFRELMDPYVETSEGGFYNLIAD